MNTIKLTWTEFAAKFAEKNFLIQYLDFTNKYDIWAYDGNDYYTTIIYKDSPANADQSDFEGNYQSLSNVNQNVGETSHHKSSVINSVASASVNVGATVVIISHTVPAKKTLRVWCYGLYGQSGTSVLFIQRSTDNGQNWTTEDGISSPAAYHTILKQRRVPLVFGPGEQVRIQINNPGGLTAQTIRASYSAVEN